MEILHLRGFLQSPKNIEITEYGIQTDLMNVYSRKAEKIIKEKVKKKISTFLPGRFLPSYLSRHHVTLSLSFFL